MSGLSELDAVAFVVVGGVSVTGRDEPSTGALGAAGVSDELCPERK
ncbi:MAG: hypothetical protein U0271_29350 [Polyangiaceae bacterium]